MEEEESIDFVPALGVGALTPLYQIVVDAFCRDSHIKKLVVSQLNEKRDLKILDVACGTGKLVKMIAAQQPCCFIIGQDLDPIMVEQATENAKEFGNVR
jgi:ubiquinone/menaquinone biosynthesis C-methylase UbiE